MRDIFYTLPIDFTGSASIAVGTDPISFKAEGIL